MGSLKSKDYFFGWMQIPKKLCVEILCGSLEVLFSLKSGTEPYCQNEL